MPTPLPTQNIKTSPYQAKLDRLNTMAQKGPLSQTNQRNLAFYQKRLGVTPQDTVQAVNPNFQGDTSVPNVNTIGFPAPAGPGPGLMGGGNPPPATNFQPGMGGNIGGSAAGTPAGMNMRTMKKGGKVADAKYMSFSKTGKPAGMKSVKKMASGGMTSKDSSASSRADGIAQRGKTKCKIC